MIRREGQPAVHPNFSFLIERISAEEATATVLDFGCGAGEFVKYACASGLDCYGADVFYAGIGRRGAEQSGLLGTRLLEIRNGKLPFPDRRFDYVTSNFVFEHVGDLQTALQEIHRVLKPGGKLIALFPTKGCVREGHLNLPFVHWLRPGPFRHAYVLSLRLCGFGEKSPGWSARQWTEAKLKFVDDLTVYRSLRQISELAGSAGLRVSFIEDDFVLFRLGRRIPFGRTVSRLMGATVMEATAPSDITS